MTTLEERIVDRLLGRLTNGYLASLRESLIAEVREIIATSPGVATLRTVLMHMRWNDQGGYPGYYNGQWNGASSLEIAPDELDMLFAFVGVVPDEIPPLGQCVDCANAKMSNGVRHERGYEGPCFSCKRPRMSNFVPISAVI